MKLLKNAKIYTCDSAFPWAEAVAIDGKKIVYVGSNADAPNADETYDLKGKMIIPGIIDSHIHPGMVSQSAWHVRLPYTDNLDEILAFIKDYAESHPKKEVPFLYFEYYPTSLFGSKGPSKEILDNVISDRPCLCQDFGEHQHWVNSKMLEMMEVTKDTPDPSPGLEMFVRDDENNPIGWVKELAWLHFQDTLYKNIDWTPPMRMSPENMSDFFQFLHEHGITAIAEGILEGEDQAKAMYELDCQNKLKVYYDGLVRFWSYEDLPQKIVEMKTYQKKYGTDHIKYNTVKLFLDGTNESGNSASLHPHRNDPTERNFGEIKMKVSELIDCLLLCNSENVDMHLHIVGDRGFRVACDAVEAAQNQTKISGGSWQMQVIFAHCEIIDPEDMPRPAKLGITINWSCHWSGGYFGEEAKNYFTDEKWNRMYQFNPIIKSGALVTFSSDVVTFYELHRADPFFSMQVAHTRVDPEFPLDPTRYPGSIRPPESAIISKEDLMKGYTINSAKQLRWEHMMGSISPGKIANLNIISDNFFTTFKDKIKDINFDAVIFDGEIIYGTI